MNFFRLARCALPHRAFARSYVTARPFVPPSQLHNIGQPWQVPSEESLEEDTLRQDQAQKRREGARRGSSDIPKIRPTSPSFYTGKAKYHDSLIQLQSANGRIRGTLKTLHLLPLPEFARASLIDQRPAWKSADDMSSDLDTPMTTTRYRRITSELNEMFEHYRIATTAGMTELANMINGIIVMFERGSREAAQSQATRKKVVLDEYGRSYTFGKRKTSAARVWMIQVHNKAPGAEDDAPAREQEASLESIFGMEAMTPAIPSLDVVPSTILVNNIPLAEYFALPADRERVVRPLKIAGVLGKYNVFTIVRGGGTTGQSGAVAHGIAKAIVAHEPGIEKVMRRSKLLRRDPRMVERKKPGLAKARKRYTWVKR